jgi:hypothetical protein
MIFIYVVKKKNNHGIVYLKLFTEYGRLALEDNDNVSKPFQVSTQVDVC